MKRIRAEQLQTTTLLYLKKRNFTDSETTFRQNFKYSSSPLETALSLIRKNLSSRPDSIAMMTQSLDDYFLAFKAFQEFVSNATKEDHFSSLQKLVCPIFLHSYLDLVVAGRSKEADEFYSLFFDKNFLNTEDELLFQLHKVKEQNDLLKVPVINKFRSKLCKVELSSSDKEMLVRFLHGQENLVVMKIINERLSFGDAKLFSPDSITAEEMLSAKKVFNEKKRRTSDLIVQDPPVATNSDPSMIITSPSSQQPVVPSRFPRSVTPENVPLNVTVDEKLLKNQIKWLHTSSPTMQGLNLFKFADSTSSITNACLSNSKQYISCCREDSSVMLCSIASSESFSLPEKNSKTADVSLVTFGSDFKPDVYERINNTRQQKHCSLTQHNVLLLQGHRGPVYSSVFTHNDEFLLTCSEDTTVRLWDLELLSNRAIFCGHNYPVLSLDVSALSLYFASGSMDTTARLWSLERTFPLRVFAGHEHSVETVAFHSNVSYLASADHTVRLWDINSGKTVRLLLGHWAPVTALAFSPDGKLLASAGEDCRIRIWDIASGNSLKEIRSHTDTIYALCFSSDSNLLASGGADAVVNVWTTTGNSPSAVSSADSLRKSSSGNHLASQWNLKETVKKIVFSQFSGDLLNCVALN